MGYQDRELICHYEHVGILPSRLPVEVLDSYDWKNNGVEFPTDVRECRFDATAERLGSELDALRMGVPHLRVLESTGGRSELKAEYHSEVPLVAQRPSIGEDKWVCAKCALLSATDFKSRVTLP